MSEINQVENQTRNQAKRQAESRAGNLDPKEAKRQKQMPWIMLACAVGMNFIFPGMLYNTLGVYTPIILREYPAFPRSLFVFAITLGNLVTAAANVFYPKLRQKLGLRGMILLGGMAILSGLFLYSSAQSLPMFYVGAALMGFSIATCASVSTVLIVNNWFAKRHGTLVAVAMAGTGIGCAAFSAVYGVWIDWIGWRASMRLSGGMAAVLIILLVLLLREKPEDIGLHKLWEEEAEEGAADKAADKATDNTAEAGIQTSTDKGTDKNPENEDTKGHTSGKTKSANVFAVPAYRAVMAMAFLIGLIFYAMLSNMTVEAGDIGLPAVQIGFVSTVIFTVNVLTQLPVGMACDRFGSIKVLTVSFAAYIAALLFLAFGRVDFAGLCVVAGIAGYGKTVMNNLTAFLVQEFVPQEDKEQVLSLCVALMTAGLAAGMYSVQLIYDLAGGYQPAYLLYVLISIGAVALLHRLRR